MGGRDVGPDKPSPGGFLTAMLFDGPPLVRMAAVFAGGLLITPILLFLIQRFAPGTPIRFKEGEDEEEDELAAAATETAADVVIGGNDADAAAPRALRRRKGGSGAAQTRPALEESRESEVALAEASLRLKESVERRAQTVASMGVKKDPFDLSPEENARLLSMAHRLMPSLNEDALRREMRDAVERARGEWQVRGDAVFDSSSGGGMWETRSLGRVLDCVFIGAVIFMVMFVLQSEYGWQPLTFIRQWFPRELATFEGRAYNPQGGWPANDAGGLVA